MGLFSHLLNHNNNETIKIVCDPGCTCSDCMDAKWAMYHGAHKQETKQVCDPGCTCNDCMDAKWANYGKKKGN